MSSKYDTGTKLLNIQSMLVKLISYIIECEHKGYMTKKN